MSHSCWENVKQQMRSSTNPKQTTFNDSTPNPSMLISQREENFKSSKTDLVTHKENMERHLRTHSIKDSFVKGALVGEATFQPAQELGCKVSGGLCAATCF